MKKISEKIILLILMTFIAACTSLNPSEQQVAMRLKSVGIQEDEMGTKDPSKAGALNILPGIGNFYLGQTGVGVANLLFWPYSILWGIPQATSDAKIINIKETVAYYTFNPEGRKKLAKLEGIEDYTINKEVSSNKDQTIEELKAEIERMKLKDELKKEMQLEMLLHNKN